MRKIVPLLMFIMFSSAGAVELSDLTSPKPLQGKVALSDKVEENVSLQPKIEQKARLVPQKSQTISENKPEIKEKVQLLPAIANENKEDETLSETAVSETIDEAQKSSVSYADMSLKRLADDVSFELDMDSEKINSDLSVLWTAVCENSETMKYTIYKLSNPDEDKPNESTIKKILKPIANFTSVAGASVAGDPYVATTALIGGGLLNAVMKDDKEYNYNFSKVSDTDMVLLVRKIDDLQKKLLDLYVDYKTKAQLVNLTRDNLQKREEILEHSQNKSKEELIIADVYYRSAKVNAQRAMDDYITSRAILENLVGLDALKKIEEM